jgi:hypothetical protein
MAGPREQKLIMEGSVCEDAHSYQDPNVKTIADARARGRVRCPNFNACVHGNDLDKRNTRCAAKFGQEVAKYALIDGTSIEVEMEAFKEEAFKSTLKGFIDPYIDHERIIIDEDEATAAVRHWANIVMLGEEVSSTNSAEIDSSLPNFVALAESATTGEGAVDLSLIEELGSRSTKTNGGIRCDTSSGPCACGAWH